MDKEDCINIDAITYCLIVQQQKLEFIAECISNMGLNNLELKEAQYLGMAEIVKDISTDIGYARVKLFRAKGDFIPHDRKRKTSQKPDGKATANHQEGIPA